MSSFFCFVCSRANIPLKEGHVLKLADLHPLLVGLLIKKQVDTCLVQSILEETGKKRICINHFVEIAILFESFEPGLEVHRISRQDCVKFCLEGYPKKNKSRTKALRSVVSNVCDSIEVEALSISVINSFVSSARNIAIASLKTLNTTTVAASTQVSENELSIPNSDSSQTTSDENISGASGMEVHDPLSSKYIVVRVENEHLQNLVDSLDSQPVSYSVCSSSTMLTVPESTKRPETQQTSSVSLKSEYDTFSHASTSSTDNVATGTAEIKTGGPVLNIEDFLKLSDESETMDTSEQHDDMQSPNISPSVAEFNRVLSMRSARNIKRYRRQLCNVCKKTFIVPFYRSKMCHASIHSGYKRYCCDFCPKRAVHPLTMRQHIKAHHKNVPGAGLTNVGYKDDMNEKTLALLVDWTERCFPDPYE